MEKAFLLRLYGIFGNFTKSLPGVSTFSPRREENSLAYQNTPCQEKNHRSFKTLMRNTTDCNKTFHRSFHESKQIFASKYLKFLPTEEELRLEIEKERRLIEANLADRKGLLSFDENSMPNAE